MGGRKEKKKEKWYARLGEWVYIFWISLASKNANGLGVIRRADKGGTDCFPALDDGFRINVPFFTQRKYSIEK